MSENIEERVVESAPVPASESLDAASQDAQLQPPADGNGAADAELPRTGEAVGASAAAGAESGQPVEEGEPGAAAPGTADGEETSPPGETPSRVAEVAHTVVEALQSGVVEARERVADVVHTVSSVLRREPAEEAGQEGAQTAAAEAVEPAAVVDAGALEDADAAGAPAAEGPGAPESAGVEGAPAGEEAAPEKRRRRRGPPKKDLEKLATLEAGQVLSGTVRSIQTYGAFVDIGMGTDGLVHISELKDGFVEKVEDVVQTGQTVEVRVKEVDRERGRISLTMRQEQRAPRTERKPAEQREPKEKRLRLRDLTEGQEVTGRVASIVDFGAFVDIGATTDGLVHISELSEDRINRVSDMLEVGQEVKARVLQVDRKRNRISLTMREQVAPEMEEIDDDDTTADLPSAMEAAFARAAENRKKDKPQRRQERSQQAELDDIIRRTLNERRG